MLGLRSLQVCQIIDVVNLDPPYQYTDVAVLSLAPGYSPYQDLKQSRLKSEIGIESCKEATLLSCILINNT